MKTTGGALVRFVPSFLRRFFPFYRILPTVALYVVAIYTYTYAIRKRGCVRLLTDIEISIQIRISAARPQCTPPNCFLSPRLKGGLPAILFLVRVEHVRLIRRF